MLLRYFGQVAINRAQIYLMKNEVKRAGDILKVALARDERYRSDYIAEILAALMLVEYKRGRFRRCIEYGTQALAKYRYIGGVVAMREIYKTMLVANVQLGETEQVEKISQGLTENQRGLYL